MAAEELLSDETPEPKKTWKNIAWSIIKTILIVLVTGGLLLYVFSKVPFAKIRFRLEHADRALLAVSVLCYFCSMLFSAWRLLSFFKSIGLKLDYRFNLRLYFLGLCYNVLLPGGIGGDGYKIYLLHKRFKLPTKKVFFAILFDRLSGFWAIGLITVALIILIPAIKIAYVIPLSVFIAGSLAYYFVAYRFFRDYTHNFLEAHLKAIVVQSFQVSAIVFLLIGQNFSGKFAPYLLSFLISSLAAIIPFSVGGGGVREYIFDFSAKKFFLMEDLAVYLSFSFYLISILVALLGVYYIFRTDKLQEGLPEVEKIKRV
jgi:uncharacterized membrane protein YbhN (UPF0104 family)